MIIQYYHVNVLCRIKKIQIPITSAFNSIFLQKNYLLLTCILLFQFRPHRNEQKKNQTSHRLTQRPRSEFIQDGWKRADAMMKW